MVERQHAAAGPDGEVLGDRRDRSARHCRIRIRPPEGVEVAFRCPDCLEAVLVSKACAIEQRLILGDADAVVIAPIEQ